MWYTYLAALLDREVHRALGLPYLSAWTSELFGASDRSHKRVESCPKDRSKDMGAGTLPGQHYQPKSVPTSRENTEKFKVSISKDQNSCKTTPRLGLPCPCNIGRHHKVQLLLGLYPQSGLWFIDKNPMRRKHMRKVKLFFPLKQSEGSSKKTP